MKYNPKSLFDRCALYIGVFAMGFHATVGYIWNFTWYGALGIGGGLYLARLGYQAIKYV